MITVAAIACLLLGLLLSGGARLAMIRGGMRFLPVGMPRLLPALLAAAGLGLALTGFLPGLGGEGHMGGAALMAHSALGLMLLLGTAFVGTLWARRESKDRNVSGVLIGAVLAGVFLSGATILPAMLEITGTDAQRTLLDLHRLAGLLGIVVFVVLAGICQPPSSAAPTEPNKESS